MCTCPLIISIQFDEFSHTKHSCVTSTHIKKQNMNSIPRSPLMSHVPLVPVLPSRVITVLSFNSTDEFGLF